MKNNKINEIEAMQVICNIQVMQEKIDGTKLPYKYFSKFSCDELHEMQNNLINDYNSSLSK